MENSRRFTAALKKGNYRMRRMFTVTLTVLALAATAPLLSACYTTAGAGKDLQAAGHGISHSAQENTTYRP